MLDRSVPYFNVIMKRPPGGPIPECPLPAGYAIAKFIPGKEESWAEIEASVGEFDCAGEAVRYFRQTYLPLPDELGERLLFVENERGEAVGTITCWWDFTAGRRDPSIHWFAVKVGYQGKGLGKALVAVCLQEMIRLEGDRDIYLHTQTWSYKAVRLYSRFGFEIVRDETFGSYRNDYDLAMPILDALLKRERE
ncbi:GNAT family N-acetyltransferase [Cohnella hashimotonis]|uniref:GNAT family N-acetyltransferase n=1 Tax=Cohnella hashimotonis TaxID=2826895 RepID=A0ABT6TRX7_9BACL|nr:GNAT family N-acetyltransferase [Cohnella hashimotonis]MDI4648983.1 GNAT family N-acetyltransferase [Cohnella hashimotonis]